MPDKRCRAFLSTTRQTIHRLEQRLPRLADDLALPRIGVGVEGRQHLGLDLCGQRSRGFGVDEYTGIAMEYGTVPVTEVIQALRAEHWLNIHPEAPAELAAQIKAQMLAAFYTDTDAWKGQIISQARQSLFQAVDGLTPKCSYFDS